MKYCSVCGSANISLTIPAGDNRERFVCPDCKTIHYSNPKVVVGTIPEWNGKILLCRRAIEPRLGLWTLPAGFMENHETTAEGAVRETREESLADVEIIQLFSMFSIPHISQVYMIYRAKMRSEHFAVTAESSELKLVGVEEIPWDELAFPVIRKTLEDYAGDLRAGSFRLHEGTIIKRPNA